LFPVERTWILNTATDVNIKRRGFCLVPDFASTAFMIQGSTLEAALADCGDILDNVGLSELMTTYVIISRVKPTDFYFSVPSHQSSSTKARLQVHTVS